MKSPAIKLRTRIGLYFFALLLAWSVIIFLSLEALLSWKFRELFKERGIAAARTLLSDCTPLVLHEDTAALGSFPTRAMRANPDLRYVIVLDDRGTVLSSSLPGGLPRDLANLRAPGAVGEDVTARLIRSRNELMYDYAAAKGPAQVRIGLSLTPAQEFIVQTATYMLWVGVAGLLAVFTIALHVSRPVEALTGAIQKAVELHDRTGAPGEDGATLETSMIASRFSELVARLEERTHQLDAAKKLAYLGELSTCIAHEVNNPLGVVVLNSEFLWKRCQKGELGPGETKEVTRLRLAAKRATLSVQRLLQFARYSMRSVDPPRNTLRLETLVGETLELLSDRLQVSGCTVRTEIPPGLPPVLCDEQGIQQVLFNLLTNAADASPPGGEILIRASADAEMFRLDVIDRGSGMSEAVLRRAKELFFTTKEHGRGTGLGLHISDSILRKHGGRLELASAPGAGTTASILIPLRGAS